MVKKSPFAHKGLCRLICNRIFKIETIFNICVQFLSQWAQLLACRSKNNNCTVVKCNLTLNIKLCKRILSFTFHFAPVGNFRSLWKCYFLIYKTKIGHVQSEIVRRCKKWSKSCRPLSKIFETEIILKKRKLKR